MANRKPRNFTPASAHPGASMEYYYQPPTGDEEKVTHTQLVTQLETGDKFVKDAGSASKATGESISIAAGTLVLALVITPSTNMTMSIGTTDGGTQILDTESLTSGAREVFVINEYFSSAGALYFTLSTGTVTVHVKKL